MAIQKRRQIISTLIIMLAILAIAQLQPFVIRSRGGLDGAFGFGPMSNDCLGLVAYGDEISYLPFTDFEFQFINFKFRYRFSEDDFDVATAMCLGQDIWIGE